MLLLVPTVATAAATPLPSTSEPPAPVGYSATWNGANLSKANSAGSAFTVNTNEHVRVNFSFTVGARTANITTARLVVYYFGAEISANSVAANPLTGSATMNWTLGTYTYLLQGIYRLSASLVYGNGSTAWSEDFYINAEAAYHIVSGVTIFLVVLALAEVYWIATVARGPRKVRPKGPRPPTPWQENPTPPSTEPPDPAVASTPPAEEAA